MNDTIESLRQHQLVILRRLRSGPMTEFELTTEVADHSGHSREEATDKMAGWLDELRDAGLVWFGTLSNSASQEIMAAALTRRGQELVA